MVCEIALRRGYKSCSFVAVGLDGEREEIGKSPQFRSRLGGAAPAETPEALTCLSALEQELESAGWELIPEERASWYAMRFRRGLVPLSRRIGAYATNAEPSKAPDEEGAAVVAAVNGATSASTRPNTARAKVERPEGERLEAERLEAERLEAERLEAERREAERLEAERVEAERLEAERLEAERLEAERLEAERLEAQRLEAERLEAERLEAERVEAARLEAERLEAERIQAARREADRLAAERTAAAEASLEATQEPEADEIRLHERLKSYSFATDHDRSIEVRAILHLAFKRPPYGHEVQHEPRY